MSETNQPDTGETCSASRHVLAIAGDLARDGHCQHIADEPTHCAESMRATVERLRAAICATLDANGHLADGEVCTLLALKVALRESGAPWAGDELHNTPAKRRPWASA